MAFVVATLTLFGNLAFAEEGFLDNGVTAHRGNSSEFPENTLAAFRSGIDVGADWIELDLYRTKDGELVVIHDATTGRVAGVDMVVANATYAELKKLDVATEFRQQHGLTVEQCLPRHIPTLREVLQLVMSQQRTRASLLPKVDCVAEAIELIKQMKAERWVGFNEGNLEYVTAVKRLAPEIPVFWDRPANTDIESDIEIALDRGFDSLVINEKGISADKVRRITAAGLIPGAWTVNDPETMRRFIDLGVERIYTDYPRTLLQLREKK